MTAPHEHEVEFERLNAFLDGELAPADCAAVAGRLAVDRDYAAACATLARLKACVEDTAVEAPTVPLPPPRSHLRRPSVAFAVILVVAAALPVGILLHAYTPAKTMLANVVVPAPILAKLAIRPTLPRLDDAGLTLTEMAIEAVSPTPVLTVGYRGPHGCRIDLRVWMRGYDLSAAPGSQHRRWNVDDLSYEIVAHGMPAWRFAIVADAAERQTRHGTVPPTMEERLREARATAPPCAG